MMRTVGGHAALRAESYRDRRLVTRWAFQFIHHPLYYSARHVPEGLRVDAEVQSHRKNQINTSLDALHQEIADEIQLSGEAITMTPCARENCSPALDLFASHDP
jgi:hypothetical protein